VSGIRKSVGELIILRLLSSPIANSKRPNPITHFGKSLMKAAGMERRGARSRNPGVRKQWGVV
jgi:hypothetical protein